VVLLKRPSAARVPAPVPHTLEPCTTTGTHVPSTYKRVVSGALPVGSIMDHHIDS
jgi:hypothetical protein